MTVTCPLCGSEMESDVEIALGQHIICPVCEKKFSYGEDTRPMALAADVPTAEPPSPARQDEPEVGQIDLSDDKMASFHRWLNAVEAFVANGFTFMALGLLLSRPLGVLTIITALVILSAGSLLLACISRGARWARISTHVHCVLVVIVMYVVPAVGEIDILVRCLAGICFLLASVTLLFPKVSRGLKNLSRRSRFDGMLCVLFWVMAVIGCILFANVPVAENTPSANISVIKLVFKILPAICGYFMYRLNKVTGGAVNHAEIVSSKTRDVACPKCGNLMCVSDTDENDLETCPSCRHRFYPFGHSVLAIVAFYLGLCSILIICAPFALLVGILALRDIKKNRGKRGITRAWFGVVMGVIFTAVLLLVLIALFAQ